MKREFSTQTRAISSSFPYQTHLKSASSKERCSISDWVDKCLGIEITCQAAPPSKKLKYAPSTLSITNSPPNAHSRITHRNTLPITYCRISRTCLVSLPSNSFPLQVEELGELR